MNKHLKLVFQLLFCLSLSLQARSQSIILDFTKRKVSADGMSWSFVLVGKGDQLYGGLANGAWVAMNVRLDLQLPPGVSIVSGSGEGEPNFTNGILGVQLLVPGSPPAGATEFGITLERPDNGTDLNTSSFDTLGRVTLNFSAPVSQGNPAFPRLAANTAGSSWSNSAQEALKRPFTFVDATFPLPVKLVSFNASKEGGQSQLTWKTSEESNSDRFDVQRSSDGKSWNTIGSRQAQGNSHVDHDYFFSDENPLSGTSLYRLNMIDLDGTNAFSHIIAVDFGSEFAQPVYPNPAADRVYLKNVKPDQVASVQIFDTAGVEVLKTNQYSEQGIETGKLASGMYVMKVTNKNNEVSSFKVVVSK